MYCTRKHLLFDKNYVILIDDENMKIGVSTQNFKYIIPLTLQTIIDWKVIDETLQLEAFAIHCKNEWKFFYADQNVCNRVKQHTDVRVVYKNIDTFYRTAERIETKAFSSVRTIKRQDNEQIYICKEMKKIKKYATMLFQNEVETLKQLNHKNIIKILEVYENEQSYQIVLEYLKGGSLKQCLKYCKLTTEEIETIMSQILEGLVYMHSNGITHRDIKPENILFSELGKFDSLKIIDFGISQKISKLIEEKDMRFGTPGYMAPEILNPQLKLPITEKIDVFSCGVVFYQMLTGSKLVQGRSQTELQDNNKNFVYDERLLSKIQAEKYKGLLQKMIASDPQKRISAREALNSFYLINTSLQNSISLSISGPHEPVQQLPNFKELIKKL